MYRFENTRNILEGFWNKCFESEKAWNSLLQSTADDWQPKYVNAVPWIIRIIKVDSLLALRSLMNMCDMFCVLCCKQVSLNFEKYF